MNKHTEKTIILFDMKERGRHTSEIAYSTRAGGKVAAELFKPFIKIFTNQERERFAKFKTREFIGEKFNGNPPFIIEFLLQMLFSS